MRERELRGEAEELREKEVLFAVNIYIFSYSKVRVRLRIVRHVSIVMKRVDYLCLNSFKISVSFTLVVNLIKPIVGLTQRI